ncbi:DNA helicase [Trifolium repens]|nr:DNA helicase [Trifolium repens]
MSSRVPPILQGSPKGWFVTMHLPDEAVGELDPCFVASFFEELGVVWEIFDSTGTPHQLQFNCSPTRPLLTTG